MYFLMFLYLRNYNKKVSVLLIELSVEHMYKRTLTLVAEDDRKSRQPP